MAVHRPLLHDGTDLLLAHIFTDGHPYDYQVLLQVIDNIYSYNPDVNIPSLHFRLLFLFLEPIVPLSLFTSILEFALNIVMVNIKRGQSLNPAPLS